jgi:hypothetical protein
MDKKQFIIQEDLANAILQYLASKPYGEVFQLIGGLQQLKIMDVPELPKLKKEKDKLEQTTE